MKIVISFVAIFIILMISLNILRNIDALRSYFIWKKLEELTASSSEVFSYDLIEGLPEAARKYFEYTIAPGTPLYSTVEIKMQGRLGLGPKDRPDYMPMTAQQIMTFPEGFIWNVKSGRGPMVITGSDGFYKNTSWSRFWLMHAVPVGRGGGLSKRRVDHRRAAFGRLVAEAVFWSPAALLPSQNVHWDLLDGQSARATITYDDLVQTVNVFIAENGQPTHVIIPRWSDANATNTYQLQPFGGYLSDFKNFAGYRLPTHVEGGNFIGTDNYFPFYIADVDSLHFSNASPD